MILLVKPPYDPAVFRSGESLGLNVLAATLERHGHPVKLLDSTLQNLGFHGLMREIKRNRPTLVGLSVTCSSFVPSAAQLAREIKKWDSSVHITAGGPYPSFAYERVLERIPEIDTVVRFEGEQSLPLLYEKIEEPDLWHEIPNLCFRDGNKIHLNETAPPLEDLDSLPWPLRANHSFGPGIRDVALLSSRGCTWDCAYCLQDRFYRHSGWRGRSALNVLNEMKHLREKWRAGAFLFNDDNFFGSSRKGRQRALELAQLFISEKMDSPWAVSCLPVDVESSLFERLKKAGLSQIFLGIESGVQSALDRWNKKVSVARNKEAFRVLRDLDLGIEVGFVFFDPYTTLGEMKENVEFLRKITTAATAPFLNRMEVHEGMAMADRLKREDRIEERDEGYHYRIEDERVERAYLLMHAILPVLAEAEHMYLSLRFESQTGGKSSRIGSRQLRKLEKDFSDRVCRSAGEIIRFVQTSRPAGSLDEQAFITSTRNALWQFAREFKAGAPYPR
jgi:radical SAM superfamily enzyme YgiQ (UPF0313 family)